MGGSEASFLSLPALISRAFSFWMRFNNSDAGSSCGIEDIIAADYNLDFCGFPHETQEILPPDEFIANYLQEKAVISAHIESILGRIADAMKQEDMGWKPQNFASLSYRRQYKES